MAEAVTMTPATGATFFYQWDLNQQLSVTGDATEIHFAQPDGTTALVVPVENGLATIPNILLQNSGTLTAYAYAPDRTLTKQRWTIVARQKAEDYVYTETEVKTWGTIEAKAANAIAIAQGARDDFDTLAEDITADIITAAEDAKSALDSVVTSANTSKTNLETAINNASTAKSQLEQVIADVDATSEIAKEIPGQVEEGKRNIDDYVAGKELELKGDTGNVYFSSFRVVNGRLKMYSDPSVTKIVFRRAGSRLKYRIATGG